MKKAIILLLLLLPLTICAQILKERRVYYLDCSYSMVTNGIWKDVCDNLVTAIDNVNDETTELVVIPFAMDRNGSLRPFSEKATSQGKQELKDKISSIVPDKTSMTYHNVPLQDFYRNRVDPARVTYMFLMTDGQDEWKDKSVFPKLLQQWQSKFGDKNVYGFYVMLHKSAQNSNIERICKDQNHLWKVETADINVNLIRLQNEAIFNVRNDKYFDLPIYGKVNGNLNVKFKDGTSPYYVDKTSIVNGKFRVYVKFKGTEHALPVSKEYAMTVNMSGGGQFDYLVTDIVKVKCERKPERSLKITVR